MRTPPSNHMIGLIGIVSAKTNKEHSPDGNMLPSELCYAVEAGQKGTLRTWRKGSISEVLAPGENRLLERIILVDNVEIILYKI